MTETKKAAPKVAANKEDTGSPSAQITALTARINEITDHLKTNKKDHMARRGLLVMVGRRKRLLKYLASKDSQAYLDLIKKLGLRR
jgi:small subunit ribosomal protein S15